MKLYNTKLIMFEGILGSGKSTMAKRVHEYLSSNGIKARLYNEGDSGHPVDLAWHAYLTKDEFDEVIVSNKELDEQIISHSIIEDNYVLVPYKEAGKALYEGELMKYLEAHEVCYSSTPTVPMEVFTEVFRKRWKRFAENIACKDEIIIFESSFFQHQIHDLMRMYAPESSAIIKHLEVLINEVMDLRPIVFYISQSSVRENLERTWKVRNTPQYDAMSSNIRFVENSQYGKKNNLTGVEGAVQFWEARKRIELEAMRKLPADSYIVDNSDYDWNKVFDNVIDILVNSGGKHDLLPQDKQR